MGGRSADGSPRSANFLTAAVAVMAVLAAVGAAVLLVNGADILRSQGERTLAATHAPSALLELRSAYGEARDGQVVRMHQLVSLPNAAEWADLRNVTLVLSTADGRATFTYATAEAEAAFTATVVRDVDGSFRPDQPILTRGDLIELSLPLALAGLPVGPGDEIEHVQIVDGGRADNTWKVPHNLGSGTIVHLQRVE